MQSTCLLVLHLEAKLVFVGFPFSLCFSILLSLVTLRSLLVAFFLSNLGFGTSDLISKHFSVLSKQD